MVDFRFYKKAMFFRRIHLLLWGILISLLFLAACQSAPSSLPEATEAPAWTQAPGEATEEVTIAPYTPAEATQSPATLVPAFTPTPMVIFEQRTVELEWPAQMRLGDADVLRLALIPMVAGYQLTAEFPDHQVQGQDVIVKRIEGYQLSAIARLDGAGFEISPQGDREQILEPEETTSWRWSLSSQSPGRQRLVVSLSLRWSPLVGTAGIERRYTIWSRGMEINVISLFGLTRRQSMTTGVAGLLFGGSLSLLAVVSLARTPRSPLKSLAGNPNLIVEPPPDMQLSSAEKALFQAIFRRYTRLVIEDEYLSGYSGARTFLARPLRSDGRADAFTIIKIGQKAAVCREFDNYQRFVKDTLPPVTARIQQPPVILRRMAASRVKFPPEAANLAALQYTFIGAPGSMPISLRKTLLENHDPGLLYRLFETFGPAWWMQRKPYVFRLMEEYDRHLPPHLVLEPGNGKGKNLDGSMPARALDVHPGEILTLRNFAGWELHKDGESLTVWGKSKARQPHLRVRWLGRGNPLGATGRVVARREDLLAESAREFELFGLPDPVLSLKTILAESVAGTQATIHGDLNLENVLVGPGGVVWLIDFAMTRDGHTLSDFAHLEAEIIAHIVVPQLGDPREYLAALDALWKPVVSTPAGPTTSWQPLLLALHEIAGRCLFNPSQWREYRLALYVTCLGALKYRNLDRSARQLLFLTAAYLARDLSN